MTTQSFRKQRVADLLRNFVGEGLTRCMDPRLQWVTVTAVDVTADLKTAWVYWTVPTTFLPGAMPAERDETAQPPDAAAASSVATGGEHAGADSPPSSAPAAGVGPSGAGDASPAQLKIDLDEVTEALAGVAPFFRRQMRHELHLRYVPEIIFRHDKSAENASRIEFLLKKAGF